MKHPSHITVLLYLPSIKNCTVSVTTNYHIRIRNNSCTRIVTTGISFRLTNKEVEQIAQNEPLWVFIVHTENWKDTGLDGISIIPLTLFKYTRWGYGPGIRLSPYLIKRYMPTMESYLIRGPDSIGRLFRNIMYIPSSLEKEYYQIYQNKYRLTSLKR